MSARRRSQLRTEVYCLHGFLGRGMDWEPLIKEMRRKHPTWVFHTPDLLSDDDSPLTPENNLEEWGKVFNAWVRETANVSQDSRRFLMGYSMGGRLALHAAFHRESLWDGLILLATNPGYFASEEDRVERTYFDADWSHRWLEDEWEHLLRDWNSLSVFRGDTQPQPRYEQYYSRALLSRAMQAWSSTTHVFSLEDLKRLTIPTLWLVGEEDSKYCAIYKTLKEREVISDYKVVRQLGHRMIQARNLDVVLELLLFLETN